MTLITDSIVYNVRQRGRKHLGQDRDFDTVALAELINGPGVQEKVKHGDMLGYFGHWPRLKFGMATQEGGIDPSTGKAVSLPLAVRTVELGADNDGTITHKAEFLDTDAGNLARGLYTSKAGGFSSAIVPVMGTSPMLAKSFHGFDYVYEPNYTTNRGHKIVLDSIGEDMAAIFDAVMMQAAQAEGEMVLLFDSLHAQHMASLEALSRVSADNDWLIDRLAQKTGITREGVFDAISEDAEGGAARLRGSAAVPDYEKYRTAALAGFSSIPGQDVPATSETRYLADRYGIKI